VITLLRTLATGEGGAGEIRYMGVYNQIVRFVRIEVSMTRVAASKVRDDFSDTLNRVAYQHERIVLRRHGKDLAAIVPVEDLELLEAVEDRIDLAAARKALADARRKGAKPISWEKARKTLGK
jgi:prevent-host-death family protein